MVRGRVLRIRIESSGMSSPALPTSTDRDFQPLVAGALAGKVAGRVDKESLAELSAPDGEDSNETTIDKRDDCVVVADGSEVFSLVVAGLRRRLEHRIEPDEKLMLAGERE